VSPLLAPDQAQIERELDKLLSSNADARVLGMRSPTHRGWPEFIDRGGRHFRVAWCASELELRERLDEVDANGSEGMVLLTPLDPTSLGGDITARLPRGRLAQSDRWTVLRNAFRVRDVDPRMRGQRWLADLLIDRHLLDDQIGALVRREALIHPRLIGSPRGRLLRGSGNETQQN